MNTYEQYIEELWSYMIQHPYQRFGQACFNTLYLHDSDYAENLRGMEIDPFYTESSKVIVAFLNDVESYYN